MGRAEFLSSCGGEGAVREEVRGKREERREPLLPFHLLTRTSSLNPRRAGVRNEPLIEPGWVNAILPDLILSAGKRPQRTEGPPPHMRWGSFVALRRSAASPAQDDSAASSLPFSTFPSPPSALRSPRGPRAAGRWPLAPRATRPTPPALCYCSAPHLAGPERSNAS